MLPETRSEFIGRREDLRSMHERLAGARLLTLVGPPGIGKTRAAIEFARRHRAEYEHVCFVPLGSARTLGVALATAGAALELDLPPLSEAQLPDAIGSAVARFGRTLLVLDNFEQLVDSASIMVDRILERAPETRVLVTSRARLHLTGEWVCELHGLSIDEEGGALALLVDRVRRLRGEYSPSAVELDQLRSIATHLEGVPLMLELAAARISTLGAANVAARLDEPMQDNLRKAIDRSWELLDDSEREVLAACSIFRGGFDLFAARAVLPLESNLIDCLHQLCEKSLIASWPRDDGGQRFHLYESIREFAAERLPVARRRDLARRHAEHYAALGERLQAEAEGRDAGETLDALTAEHGNLIAAADRGLSERDGVSLDCGMRALLALAPLALARGPIAPLVEKLDGTLERTSELAPRLRVAAHLAAGRGHRRLGRQESARRHQAGAIELASSLCDDRLIAEVTSDAAMTLLSQGDLGDALGMLKEAVTVRERVGDQPGAALDRLRMGIALRELGRIDEAESLLRAAVEVFRRSENSFRAGLVFAELVHVALDRGRYAEANELLDRARSSNAQSASRLTDASLRARAGMLAHAQGDLATAETSLQAAMIGLRRIGYRRFEAGVIGYLGVVELELGRLEIARDRFLLARDMVAGDTRAAEIFSGWICAVEVERGDREAARRAAEKIGPLRANDPLSVAGHVLAASLTDVVPQPLPLIRSHDVRLAFRVVLEERAHDQGPADALRVAASGEWFVLPCGRRGECNRYRALRLILLELVKQRLLRPQDAVPRELLVAAGWPGERILEDAARNRLKVAIASLRRAGLQDLLHRSGSGYFLDAAVPIVVIGDQ